MVSLEKQSEEQLSTALMQLIDMDDVKYPGFLLFDYNEHLKVESAEKFLQKLGCQSQAKIKVVSIIGNKGDGKSHTLNYTFFGGDEVFEIPNSKIFDTLGVWAAYDPKMQVIVLDTEGLMEVSNYENARTRLLLKVLAISDIVIYRTKSEKLSGEMFMFLSWASNTYSQYFDKALQDVSLKGEISLEPLLGPCLIIFHETERRKPFEICNNKGPEYYIRNYFASKRLHIDSFSSLKYVGTQTTNQWTNFDSLKECIRQELRNTTVRSPREPQIIYKALCIFNERISGNIDSAVRAPVVFPEEYFTCSQVCHSCGARCQKWVGHTRNEIPHSSREKCKYQHRYENLGSFCKTCYQNGDEIEVTSQYLTQKDDWLGLVKYAWMGSVIECPRCGEIYRSRKHWYGNEDLEDCAVLKEAKHVWQVNNAASDAQNTAQRVVDSVAFITEAVSSVSLQPTKLVSEWISDQIAPSYWRPNHKIVRCYNCRVEFEPTDKKHHCRGCGEGFCGPCSSKRKPVPARNWHEPVRVCDKCFENPGNEVFHYVAAENDISVRKVSEQLVSTLSTVGTVFSYPVALIKETVRPAYWVPDSEITDCCVCSKLFSEMLPLHHCRDCGRGVCQDCSPHRRAVLHRGWSEPVRVCDDCVKTKQISVSVSSSF